MSTDPIINRIRQSRATLVREIATAGSTIRGTTCTCPHPEHEDRHPSASIHANPAGIWRVTCHSRACWGKGADVFDLRAARTGRPVADLLREARAAKAATPPHHNPVASPRPTQDLLAVARSCADAITPEQTTSLADQLGVSIAALSRLGLGWHAKLGAYTFPMRDAANHVVGIRTRLPDGSKRAIKGSTNGLFVPMDLPANGTLHIVEGPTDCAALIDRGLTTIGRPSNTAGADHIVSYVREHSRQAVVIVTDADTNTRTHAATAAAAERLAADLVPLVGDVRIITPPKPHKDARAWCNAGATADDIEAAAEAAPSRGPSGELHVMLQAVADGKRRAIAWPWSLVTRGTQALIPGSITMVCGEPGSGKSLWLLESLTYWHDKGEGIACQMLECSRAEHLLRALAQRVGAAWLTDLKQVESRRNEVMALHAEHAAWLDSFGRAIHTPGDKDMTLGDLIDWITNRAAEGARIIAIDPVTIAETTDRPWDDARRFLIKIRRIIYREGASLLMVTHPAKTRGRFSGAIRTLDDLAGGSAWTRLVDCVLWLERHDEPRTVNVLDGICPLPQTIEAERTLRIMKARHGRGTGWQVAVTLDHNTLRFHERGAIVKPRTPTHPKTVEGSPPPSSCRVGRSPRRHRPWLSLSHDQLPDSTPDGSDRTVTWQP